MSDGRCTFCDAYNPPGQRNCVSCGAELPGALDLPPPPSEAGGGLEDEVVRLANEQGIIPAIKRYREATGVGLAEAKAAVEGLIAGATTGAHDRAISEAGLMAIVRDHGKIAAIRRHREATGSGLKEAKEAVEAMMARTGTQAGKSTAGCGTYVLLAVVALFAVWRLSAGGF